MLAAVSMLLVYYNITMWDAMSWIGRKGIEGCSFISAWLADQFGESAGKFVFDISLLYVVMMGIALVWTGLFNLAGRLLWWCLQRTGILSGTVPGVKHGSNATTSKNLTAAVMNPSHAPTLSDVSSVDSVASSLSMQA